MARTGRPKQPLVLSNEERSTLERLAKRRNSAQAIARARIVLVCSEPGVTNVAIAAGLGVNPATVGKWRARFVAGHLNGLFIGDRPGAPRTITDDKVEALIVKTSETKPGERISNSGH